MIRSFLIVGMGSFLGGGLRFLLSRFIQNFIEISFPVGTLIINIAGCFIIGLLYGLFEQGNLLNSDYRMFLTAGFCGGFTTFSTFINENFQLLKDSNIFYLSLYITLSLIGGIIFIYLGHITTKIL